MMKTISDQDIKTIVQRVLQQSLSSPDSPENAPQVASEPHFSSKRTVVIGTDHGGLDLKEILKNYLIR